MYAVELNHALRGQSTVVHLHERNARGCLFRWGEGGGAGWPKNEFWSLSLDKGILALIPKQHLKYTYFAHDSVGNSVVAPHTAQERLIMLNATFPKLFIKANAESYRTMAFLKHFGIHVLTTTFTAFISCVAIMADHVEGPLGVSFVQDTYTSWHGQKTAALAARERDRDGVGLPLR